MLKFWLYRITQNLMWSTSWAYCTFLFDLQVCIGKRRVSESHWTGVTSTQVSYNRLKALQRVQGIGEVDRGLFEFERSAHDHLLSTPVISIRLSCPIHIQIYTFTYTYSYTCLLDGNVLPRVPEQIFIWVPFRRIYFMKKILKIYVVIRSPLQEDVVLRYSKGWKWSSLMKFSKWSFNEIFQY